MDDSPDHQDVGAAGDIHRYGFGVRLLGDGSRRDQPADVGNWRLCRSAGRAQIGRAMMTRSDLVRRATPWPFLAAAVALVVISQPARAQIAPVAPLEIFHGFTLID